MFRVLCDCYLSDFAFFFPHGRAVLSNTTKFQTDLFEPSGRGSNGNEELIYISQSFRTEALQFRDMSRAPRF